MSIVFDKTIQMRPMCGGLGVNVGCGGCHVGGKGWSIDPPPHNIMLVHPLS